MLVCPIFLSNCHFQESNFQSMSDQVLKKLDEMTERVDDLEGQVSRLIKESGVEPPKVDEES